MTSIATEPVSFRHLALLTDDRGILEHAKGIEPRYQHGYCTDDNARLLVVCSRADAGMSSAKVLATVGLNFVIDAMASDGAFRNRMSFERCWVDEPCTNDCWGRALWGLGSAYSLSTDHALRAVAIKAFDKAAVLRSEHPRAMAFAALGAAEVVGVDRQHELARRLLGDAATMIDQPGQSTSWPWPQARLTYSNASLAEVLIAAGSLLNDKRWEVRGLELLDWLLQTETLDQHLSVTPASGRGPGDPRPAFDQQPIEVAALADACARAHRVTDSPKWLEGVALSIAWFQGKNDAHTPMIDHSSGGGYDGLESSGVNINQGAESTIAMLMTLQHQRLVPRGEKWIW